MSPSTVVGVAFSAAGAIIFLCGYLIGVKKQLWLISGYNPDRVKDKDGLAKWVGTGLQIIGGIEFLMGILALFVTASVPIVGFGFGGVTIIGVMVLIAGAIKFAK